MKNQTITDRKPDTGQSASNTTGQSPALTTEIAANTKIGLFERLLTVWVVLFIAAGLVLGHFFPEVFLIVDKLEVRHINAPVTVMIWLMIIPVLLRVDLSALPGLALHWPSAAITLIATWLIKPFAMALLAWAFIGHWLTPWLPATEILSTMVGMIILGALPCMAMVLGWSALARGELRFAAASVALNAMIAIFAFVPLTGLLLWLTAALGLTSAAVPLPALLIGSILYFLGPLTVAVLLRLLISYLDPKGGALKGVLSVMRPLGLLALFVMVMLVSGVQSNELIRQPQILALLAVPLLVQIFLVFGIAYLLNRWVGAPHGISGPSALIATSHFFVFALGITTLLFGLKSGANLVILVWLLIEMPMMLLLVALVSGSSGWFKPSKTTETSAASKPPSVPDKASEPSLPLPKAREPAKDTRALAQTRRKQEPAAFEHEPVDSANWVAGEVVADRQATLNAPISGLIRSCLVRAGDQVETDDELMRIAFADGAATVSLRAPWPAVVRHVHVPVEGSSVETGQPLVELIATDGFMLRFAVPESDAEALRPGDKVQVRFKRRQSDDVELKILRAWPELDRNTRTRSFDARLPDDLNAYVGLGALVRIATEETDTKQNSAPPQLERPPMPRARRRL